jgi:predicted ester cyclase
MSVNVIAYEKLMVDGLNRGDVSPIDEAFAPDAVIHMGGVTMSVEGYKQVIGGLIRAFPDFRVTVADQVVSDGKVATRWVAEGTRQAAGDGPAAFESRIDTSGLVFDYVVDGRVVERWQQWDEAGLLRAFGLA